MILKKRKWIYILITAAVIIALLVILPFARGYIIMTYGLLLKPDKIIPPRNAQAFLQNDERWRADKMGSSGLSMGGHGCLVCCAAGVLCGMGYETDPGKLNRLFNEKGVYNDEGEIVWGRLTDALDVSYANKKDFGANTVERLLESGILPIVKVKYNKTGVFHWVVITGSVSDDFLILDPLNSEQNEMPLSSHGRVYALRVLEKK